MENARPAIAAKGETPSQKTCVALTLPDILEMIFKFLNTSDKGRAARVCVAWKIASYSPSLWQDVVAELSLTDQDSAVYASLEKRRIRHIRVSSAKTLLLVVQQFSNLKSLYLDSASPTCGFTNWDLTRSFTCRELTQLRKLNLDYCCDLTDHSVLLISKCAMNLSFLSLCSCNYLTDKALIHIANGFPKLNWLELKLCSLITNNGLYRIADKNISLKYIGISCCHNVTDPGIKALSVGLKSLDTIDLNDCSNITDDGVKYLSELEQLSKIELRSCHISNAGLDHLSSGKSFSSIVHLDIGENSSITNEGLKCIGKMTNILYLDLRSCTEIGDTGLYNLLDANLNLTSLNLSSCYNLTDSGVASLASIKSLQFLNLSFCNITDQGLANLVNGASAIAIMDLRGCNHVTDAGLEYLANLPNLQKLFLRGYHNITSSNLFRLIECLDECGIWSRIYEKVLV